MVVLGAGAAGGSELFMAGSERAGRVVAALRTAA